MSGSPNANAASTTEPIGDPVIDDAAIHIIGAGRAGRSLHRALREVGCEPELHDRTSDVKTVLRDADIVILAVSDGAIAEVAASIEPGDGVVLHLSGSRQLDVLAPHRRTGSMHPLMSLPDEMVGAARLLDACHFAVCGDPITSRIVARLGGIAFDVANEHRATYHAAACVAANHIVTLCAQVERLADAVDVPRSAFWAMVEASVANVTEMGATAALTGPAARGDWETIAGHLDAIGEGERALYRAVAKAAAELAGNDWPDGHL